MTDLEKAKWAFFLAQCLIIIVTIGVPLVVVYFIRRALFRRCDCVLQIDHYAAGMTGRAAVSFVPAKDCPKCKGTGTVWRGSPWWNKLSPVRANGAGAVTAVAGSAIFAASDEHDRLSRLIETDARRRHDEDALALNQFWQDDEDRRRINELLSDSSAQNSIHGGNFESASCDDGYNHASHDDWRH